MHSVNYKRFETSAVRAVFALIVAAGLVFAVGCGGGGSSLTANPTPTPNNSSASNTQVRIGDAPADSVIAFEVSLTALSLTPSGGGAAVSIPVGANNRIELSHQSGKFEPLALGNLPQGTFSSASLTLANSELTFMTGTGPVHINGPASAQVTVNLSPALTIGSSPTVIAIDVNVTNSITTNASGVITGISFGASSFTITAKAPGAQAGQQDDDGEIEDVRGTVTAATSSNFTLKVGQTGSSMTFNFDASTKFSDGVTAATLLNQIVTVEGFTKSDGNLFATEVEGQEASTGSELEGMIRSISGTLLTVTAHDGSGSGMDDTKVGADFTVSINGLSASKFRVDAGNGFGSLVPNTLSFDGTTIHAGQQIEVESTSAVPAANGSITADKLKLQQQGVSGTAANVAASTFDINLAADSALAVISGQTVVHVTKVSLTDTRKTVSNGTAVQVRGLLFWNGTSWQLIARRIR
jgi:uncharacterized protein DUF5666